MKHSQKSYSELSKAERNAVITELYSNQGKSFADIAELYGTYANKVRRDAKLFNIPIRDKSEAQKNALKTGAHKHPTKGTQRPTETKEKIGKAIVDVWDNMDDASIEARRQKCKEKWEQLSDDDKKNMQKMATDAVRMASKTGSKLEKFLLDGLLKRGYKVDFHKEQSLVTTKLQIDLFLPTMNTAIEVDGPSHFSPVWGDDALKKNITYDNKKQGLILGKGLVLIRIKQTKDFSKTRSQKLLLDLINHLETINNKFPGPQDRLFLIED
jgi:very-short-patch-repair endonuclease